MMHILFLTDNFPPEVNAPASRTFEHCRVWVSAGHRVTVITCAPNFPSGKVFDGYRNRLWQEEWSDGIRIIRVWSYITANEGFVKRVADYVSFMISAVLAAMFVRRFDVVVGTSPQFFTALAAFCVSMLRRRPWIFELRDFWPESINAVGAMKKSRALDWLEKLELFLYRRADRIVAVTHSFRRKLIERGVDGGKIAVVTNGVDTSRYAPTNPDAELRAELGLSGKFVAGYVGTHGMAHALETLLDAAEQLRLDARGDDIAILFLGDGARKSALVADARARGLANVTFVDMVSKDDVARYWSVLDVSIIHLRDTPLFSTVIPSKLFESMGMGIPILLGVRGEAAEILSEMEAGESFPPEDANALVAQLIRFAGHKDLCRRYGRRGQQAASKYDRRKLALNMLEILQEAARN